MNAKDMSARKLRRRFVSLVRECWRYELAIRRGTAIEYSVRTDLGNARRELAEVNAELNRRGWETP